MATKAELEAMVEQVDGKNKELQAMISVWSLKLESVKRSADHPFSIIDEVIESMKEQLGV